ncbi:hypothetical protein L6164_023674 [Bauhinia variegata]|uniref:Uncharacterized protein n=1 Tax=Bauhinia variegata TaxID=167791 RepID=A0ACB9MJD2_BAUVA|nr:hypothetical protein L6164_023674 [Bauhinia variegata]
MATYFRIAFLVIALCSTFIHCSSSEAVDFTIGFTEVPLNSSSFHNHYPFNLNVSDRYSFIDGIHRFWIYADDKPMINKPKAGPRSEIRIQGYDYSHGVWQFEGHGLVPSGSSGVSVMQLFGSDPPRATTLMVRTYNGSLTYYRRPVLVPNIWDRWFKLNVIHDVEASKVKIYIDAVMVYEAQGNGGTSHYFKFGVYKQNDPSYYMESRWKGIRVFTKYGLI